MPVILDATVFDMTYEGSCTKEPGEISIDQSFLSTSTFVSHGVLIRQLLQAWYFALKRRGNRTTAPRVNVGFEISLMCPVGQENRLIIRDLMHESITWWLSFEKSQIKGLFERF